jgi:hypothetical protein
MAALALIAGSWMIVGLALPSLGQSNTPKEEQGEGPAAKEAESNREGKGNLQPESARTSAIHLNLAIAGLGREGCEVEVKPGNASCRFRVLNVAENGVVFKKGAQGPQHVSSNGYAYMELRDIQLRGADSTCSVAITVREPGQSPRTVFRGFRLAPKATPAEGAASSAAKLPSFTCYLNAPSKIARLDESTTRK